MTDHPIERSTHKTRDALVAQAEAKLKEECTFKPKINKLPQNYNAGVMNINKDERLKRLS